MLKLRRQIATLDAIGIDIGGHTRTHPQLDTLPSRRVCDEVMGLQTGAGSRRWRTR